MATHGYDFGSVARIEATVILDRVYLEGDLIEETFDWHGQDRDGTERIPLVNVTR